MFKDEEDKIFSAHNVYILEKSTKQINEMKIYNGYKFQTYKGSYTTSSLAIHLGWIVQFSYILQVKFLHIASF